MSRATLLNVPVLATNLESTKSLHQYGLVNTALAETVAALEAEEVFTRRAARVDRARFLAVLEQLGNEPPRAGDELD